MSHSKGNWIIGIFIIIIGFILLFNNIGITNVDLTTMLFTYWPILFVLFGLQFLLNKGSKGEVVSGLIFVCIGAVLLAKTTGFLNINLALLWNLVWPTIIILIGLSFFFGHSSNGKSNFAIMGAIEKKTQPWVLQSSSFVAFWGGIDLDLTLAEIPDGETIIDLTAIMGGINIIIPSDINIECQGTTILGGLELLDKSTGGILASTSSLQTSSHNTNKSVKFYSRAIMGGIEIKQKNTYKC